MYSSMYHLVLEKLKVFVVKFLLRDQLKLNLGHNLNPQFTQVGSPTPEHKFIRNIP